MESNGGEKSFYQEKMIQLDNMSRGWQDKRQKIHVIFVGNGVVRSGAREKGKERNDDRVKGSEMKEVVAT